MVFVVPNFNRRSKNFFSSLGDPRLEWQSNGANYFPRVWGGCRFVAISGGAPPPLIPFIFLYPTPVTGVGQANTSPSRHFRDIKVGRNPPSSVSPLPNASHQTSNNFFRTISNEKTGPDENEDSDSLWGKILTVVNCAIEKGFGFFGLVPPRSFYLSNENVARLGKFAFISLGFCFALRQAYNLGKASVHSKLDVRETITARESGENVLRAENGGECFENVAREGGENVFREGNGGFCENVGSDQNKNNGTERMASHLLSKMFCFLRLVERSTVDVSRGLLVGSGRKTLDACGVILSKCFSCVHFITDQAAVSFGRMGMRVSEFCLEKFWDLLRSIKCQAFGLPGQMIGWSVGTVQDALGIFIVWSPGKVQGALSFYMTKVKQFLRF